jgi:DNA polymerase-4
MEVNQEDIVKKIIHVDMDAFYASVEQLDFPEYRGKPLAVGGSRERGVVSAASYEARKYGVRSAMSSAQAVKLCPNIIFVKGRFDRYKEISKKMHEIFKRYTDLIEPLSLDEAYLDVTENKKNIFYATQIAIEIRKAIKEEIGLTASAGVSFNKFLAKIASDLNKPDGLAIITPDKAERFIEQLEINKFFGIGKVTAAKMMNHGIFNGADLKSKDLDYLTKHFGKSGRYYYNMVRLKDNRSVNPNRIRKSIGCENTFFEDLATTEEMLKKLEKITHELERRMKKAKAKGKTLTLKVKYHDFTVNTRSKTFPFYISKGFNIKDGWTQILDENKIMIKPIRLLGLSISNLERNRVQKKYKQLKFEF